MVSYKIVFGVFGARASWPGCGSCGDVDVYGRGMGGSYSGQGIKFVGCGE